MGACGFSRSAVPSLSLTGDKLGRALAGRTWHQPLGCCGRAGCPDSLSPPCSGQPALGAPALGALALGAPALGAPALGAPAAGSPALPGTASRSLGPGVPQSPEPSGLSLSGRVSGPDPSLPVTPIREIRLQHVPPVPLQFGLIRLYQPVWESVSPSGGISPQPSRRGSSQAEPTVGLVTAGAWQLRCGLTTCLGPDRLSLSRLLAVSVSGRGINGDN